MEENKLLVINKVKEMLKTRKKHKAMLLIINDVTKYLIAQDKLIALESIETRNKLLLNIEGEQ